MERQWFDLVRVFQLAAINGCGQIALVFAGEVRVLHYVEGRRQNCGDIIGIEKVFTFCRKKGLQTDEISRDPS